MLYGADVVSVFHYSRMVLADGFRSGRLPLWDPHVMAGFPMLAEPQSAVFYPPTWLCVLLSAGRFWTWSAWVHLIFAGVFAQRWLELGLGLNRWSGLAGALIYMMSGYISGHVLAGHVNYVWAYPWIPALLWRLERFLGGPTLRRGLVLSVVLALLFLAGVPQYVFFAGLLVFSRLVHFVVHRSEGRRNRAGAALRAAGWLALGLAWCAPQLFPTLELVGQMHRGGAGSSSYFRDYSLSPTQLDSLLLPGQRTRAQGGAWWETCGFVGGAVFLLMLAAFTGNHRHRHLWAAIGALAVILAFGDAVPLYPGFVAVIPGAGWFRGPGRYLLLFTVSAAALAGMGVEALWQRGPRALRLVAGSLALVSLFQLTAFALPCYVPQSESLLQLSTSLRSRLEASLGQEGRLAHRSGDQLEGDVPLIGMCQAAGLDSINGYEPMMLRRFVDIMNAAAGTTVDREMVVLAAVRQHPLIDMLAARVWIWPRGVRDYPDAMPRSWVVNNAVVIEDPKERLHALAAEPWDPRKTVILESLPNDPPPVTTEKPAGRATVVSRAPGDYEIRAENDAPAYLVLSEAYYPGWEAEVDGRPTEVLPANHLIQAIRLPAGKHEVRIRYHSRFLALGVAVAALAALVPGGLLVRRHRRQLPLQGLPGAP